MQTRILAGEVWVGVDVTFLGNPDCDTFVCACWSSRRANRQLRGGLLYHVHRNIFSFSEVLCCLAYKLPHLNTNFQLATKIMHREDEYWFSSTLHPPHLFQIHARFNLMNPIHCCNYYVLKLFNTLLLPAWHYIKIPFTFNTIIIDVYLAKRTEIVRLTPLLCLSSNHEW